MLLIVVRGIADGLARVVQDFLEEPAIFRRQGIVLLTLFTLGERRLLLQIGSNIAAPALHKMRCQSAPLLLMLCAGEVFGQGYELGLEQSQERAEGRFVATMRGGC